MLTLHRRLLALRRAEPALAIGGYRTRSVTDAVYVYERHRDGRTLAVALNLTGIQQPLALAGGTVALSTHPGDPHPVTSAPTRAGSSRCRDAAWPRPEPGAPSHHARVRDALVVGVASCA
ncbi:MAG TPA: DUF3459 domain-containing protein [Euzebyales bacterium]